MKRLLQISNYLYIHLIYIINYQDDLFFLLKNYFFTITYYHRFIDIAWVSTLIISFFLILDELNKLKIENITYKNINNNLLNNYHKVSQELTNYRIFKHNIYANLLSLKYQNDKAPYIDNLLVKFTNKKTIKYSNALSFSILIFISISKILKNIKENRIFSYLLV